MSDWIPITTRPLTDEEKELFADNEIDFTTMLNCPLPEDGDEVLISYGGTVMVDIFVKDGDGCYFEQADIDDVDAWMPLPKPYEVDKE